MRIDKFGIGRCAIDGVFAPLDGTAKLSVVCTAVLEGVELPMLAKGLVEEEEADCIETVFGALLMLLLFSVGDGEGDESRGEASENCAANEAKALVTVEGNEETGCDGDG